MITGYALQVLNAARNQTTKAGKHKMNEINRKLIADFITFDPQNEWMESKDYTKLSKALASAVIIGSELIGEPLVTEDGGVKLWNMITQLRVNRQYNIKLPVLIQRIEKYATMVDAYEAIQSRLTRNGKFPKEEAERRRREIIKGSLDPKLSVVLHEIKDAWIKIIFKFEYDWLLNQAVSAIPFVESIQGRKQLGKEESSQLKYLRFYNIVKFDESTKLYSITESKEFEKMAEAKAQDEGASFFFKMADKLGGLVTGKHQFISAEYKTDGKTPFSSFIHFKFEGNTSFSIENKIVENRSPLNNYFYQYPCTFYNVIINGEKLTGVSEFIVKKAFANV